MLIPKKNKHLVYSYLLKEGVLVAKKDAYIQHPDLELPNLHVMMLMRSLRSREYVREQYAWRHLYYYLTDSGIDYLRDYLHLPTDIVPATMKKTTRAVGNGRGFERRSGPSRFGDKDRAPRGEYREDRDRPRGPGAFGRGGGFGGRGRGFGDRTPGEGFGRA